MSEVKEIPAPVREAMQHLSANDGLKVLLQWAWEETRERVYEEPSQIPAVQTVEWLASLTSINLTLRP